LRCGALKLQEKPRAQIVYQVNVVRGRVAVIEKYFIIKSVELVRVAVGDLIADIV
jgi:hypothetical protein